MWGPTRSGSWARGSRLFPQPPPPTSPKPCPHPSLCHRGACLRFRTSHAAPSPPESLQPVLEPSWSGRWRHGVGLWRPPGGLLHHCRWLHAGRGGYGVVPATTHLKGRWHPAARGQGAACRSVHSTSGSYRWSRHTVHHRLAVSGPVDPVDAGPGCNHTPLRGMYLESAVCTCGW